MVVRPNFDTLSSLAWLDVSREPIVLSVPGMPDRYYLLPLLDMWTDVFSVIGTRTTGTKAGDYAIVAPDWNGTLPSGVTKIVAPTPMIWVLGRTQTNGPADFANVHKVQDGYKLTPLSDWGKPGATISRNAPTDLSIDMKMEPVKQVSAMDGVTMLTRLADLLEKYPPHPNDYPILFRLRRLGFTPGEPFDASKLDPALAQTINTAAKDALGDLSQSAKRGLGAKVNGWSYALECIGTYGTDYKRRAVIALAGLGANLPEDTIYPMSFADGKGQPYSGANRYVLHFELGKLPPANAFWSVTVYDTDGFVVPNRINRYALGDRDKLRFNADGGLDIYIQNDSPGAEKESNWLPAPAGAFNLTMRIYSPQRDVTAGMWAPPAVARAR
jgi:hypothetical protein